MPRVLITLPLLLIASLPLTYAAEKRNTPSKFAVELQASAMKYFGSTQNELLRTQMYSQIRDVIKVSDGDLVRGINKLATIDEDPMAFSPEARHERQFGPVEVIPLGADYALTVTPFKVKLTDFQGNPRQLQGVNTLVWERERDGWHIVHIHESTSTPFQVHPAN